MDSAELNKLTDQYEQRIRDLETRLRKAEVGAKRMDYSRMSADQQSLADMATKLAGLEAALKQYADWSNWMSTNLDLSAWHPRNDKGIPAAAFGPAVARQALGWPEPTWNDPLAREPE